MGARMQAWVTGGQVPPGNVVKCFVHLVIVKRAVDQLFMYYFHNFRRLLGQSPPGAPPLDSAGGLLTPGPLICPPLEKNPAVAHVRPVDSELSAQH